MPWIQQQDSTGSQHSVCAQALDSSCLAACTAMVCRAHGKSTDERLARDMISKYEVNSVPTWKTDVALGFIWNEQGTLLTSASQALSNLGIHSAYTWKTQENTDNLKKKIRLCSPNKPGITRIEWQDGGGHFVTVCGLINQVNVLILDPYYGLQEISFLNLPNYSAFATIQGHDIPGGAARGSFDAWGIVTTN